MPRGDRPPLLTGASGLPAPSQRPNVDTQPFWDGTAEGKVVLPRCNACQFVIWYRATSAPTAAPPT